MHVKAVIDGKAKAAMSASIAEYAPSAAVAREPRKKMILNIFNHGL